MAIELSIDQTALTSLARRLGDEADGKKLRRDLAKNMRKAIAPGVVEARANLMAMGTRGLPTEGEPLRRAVARGVRAEVRLGGRQVGAKLSVRKRGMPRGFKNAPARLNAAAGWRRRLWGRDQWVTQMGRPGWFDDVPKANRRRYRAAVVAAMSEAAKRISRGAR